MPRIAELAVSGLGNTFIMSADDTVNSGLYAGEYVSGQVVPDPNCEQNGGILDGRCRFRYGTRFNIYNDEDHNKFYFSLSNSNHDLTLLTSKVQVNDNPQSPSYPALPFLSRLINNFTFSFGSPIKFLGWGSNVITTELVFSWFEIELTLFIM